MKWLTAVIFVALPALVFTPLFLLSCLLPLHFAAESWCDWILVTGCAYLVVFNPVFRRVNSRWHLLLAIAGFLLWALLLFFQGFWLMGVVFGEGL
jgi:hypothetical protein